MRYYPCQPLTGAGQYLGDCPTWDVRPKVVRGLTAPLVRYLILPAVRTNARDRPGLEESQRLRASACRDRRQPTPKRPSLHEWELEVTGDGPDFGDPGALVSKKVDPRSSSLGLEWRRSRAT